MKPSSQPFSIPVPAMTSVSKESLFARADRARCDLGVFHRVVMNHSLSMMFSHLLRHARPFSVASSAMTVPVVYPFHRLSTSFAAEDSSLN